MKIVPRGSSDLLLLLAYTRILASFFSDSRDLVGREHQIFLVQESFYKDPQICSFQLSLSFYKDP